MDTVEAPSEEDWAKCLLRSRELSMKPRPPSPLQQEAEILDFWNTLKTSVISQLYKDDVRWKTVAECREYVINMMGYLRRPHPDERATQSFTKRTCQAELKVYASLRAVFKKYLKDMVAAGHDLQDAAALGYYANQYTIFSSWINKISHVLQFLIHPWLPEQRRAEDPTFRDVYEIKDLGHLLWIQIVYASLEHQITASLMPLVQRQESGDDVAFATVKEVVTSFRNMAIDMDMYRNLSNEVAPLPTPGEQANGEEAAITKGRTLYSTVFEAPYLVFLDQHLQQRGVAIRQQLRDSPIEYIQTIQAEFKKVLDKAEQYMEQSTCIEVTRILRERLILEALDDFRRAVTATFESNGENEVFSLCKVAELGGEACVQLVAEHFKAWLIKVGRQKVQNAVVKMEGKGGLTDRSLCTTRPSTIYTEAIIGFYGSQLRKINRRLARNHMYVRALDEALFEVVNRNRLHEKFPQANSLHPKMFAAYCGHTLFRKDLTNHPEENTDVKIFVKILQTINNRESFFEQYALIVIKRVVRIGQHHDEMKIPSAMTKIVPGWRANWMTLEQDLNDSEWTTNLLKEEADDIGFKFNVHTFSSSILKDIYELPEWTIPPCIQEAMDKYTTVCATKGKRRMKVRNLKWYSHSQFGSIKFFPGGKEDGRDPIKIDIDFGRAAILINFNTKLEWSFQELLEVTTMKPSELTGALNTLVKSKILRKTPETPDNEYLRNTILTVNDDFFQGPEDQQISLRDHAETKQDDAVDLQYQARDEQQQ